MRRQGELCVAGVNGIRTKKVHNQEAGPCSSAVRGESWTLLVLVGGYLAELLDGRPGPDPL